MNTDSTFASLDLNAANMFPEPTQIVIDENTDMSKIHEKAEVLGGAKLSRGLVALEIFKTPYDFMNWQREAPREIYEIIPTMCVGTDNEPEYAIFVTHNGGIIQ